MKRVLLIAAATGALTGVLVCLAAQAAFADTSQIGKNIGDEVQQWAKMLLLAVAGLVAIPVLARRDVNGGLVLALLVIIVGGFAYAQGSVQHVIAALWRSIAG